MGDFSPKTVCIGMFKYFDTGGRFWTPEWDNEHNQPKDVAEVLMQDGTWHNFSGFVCMAHATKFRISKTYFLAAQKEGE